MTDEKKIRNSGKKLEFYKDRYSKPEEGEETKRLREHLRELEKDKERARKKGNINKIRKLNTQIEIKRLRLEELGERYYTMPAIVITKPPQGGRFRSIRPGFKPLKLLKKRHPEWWADRLKSD